MENENIEVLTFEGLQQYHQKSKEAIDIIIKNTVDNLISHDEEILSELEIEIQTRKNANEEIWKSIDEKFSLSISGGGSGTETDPYVILSEEDLKKINEHLESHYILGGSIYINNTWEPLNNFSGVFDGRGYTIYNLNITHTYSPTYAGLFMSNSGTILNVRFENVNVDTNSTYVGAIVGTNDSNGTISCCSVASGNVSGNYYVGGLCGKNIGTITDSYNKATIIAKSYTLGMGGIAGENTGNIQNTYSIGELDGHNIRPNGHYGSIAGMSTTNIENSYGLLPFNIVGNKSNTSNTSIGKDNFITSETFLNWDFDTIWKIEDKQCPTLQVNQSCDINISKHKWFSSSPSGTSTDPFHIVTLQDLQYISACPYGNYIFMNDISMKNGADYIAFDPIGSEDTPFTGSLDGNGYSIKDLKISSAKTVDGTDYAALFAVNNGTIKNLVVIPNVVGSEAITNAAVVAGVNNGKIEQVAVTSGKVIAKNTAGLVNVNNAEIINSYVNVTAFRGSEQAAGITINNTESGTIKYVYSIPDLSGVTGTSKATIAIDSVGAVTNTYALMGNPFIANDSTILSDTANKNGTATTTKMKQQSTFRNWDFTNTWYMVSGSPPLLLITLHTSEEKKIAELSSALSDLSNTVDMLTIAILEE